MPNLISVVTPVYNSGKLLNDLHECLRKQTYKDFEWLIINDGSTDKCTLSILDELEANETFVRRFDSHNNGAPVARNKGIKYAKGELIKFIDADDLIPENHFKSQVKKIKGSTQKNDVVVSPVRVLSDFKDSQSIVQANRLREEFFKSPLQNSLQMFEFHHSGCLYQIDFIRSGNIFWDESLRAYQDLDFLWQCMLKGSNFIIDNDTYFINREHNYTERITTSESPGKWISRYSAVENVYEKIKDEQEELLEDVNKRFDKVIVGSLIELPSTGFKLLKKKKKLTGVGLNKGLIIRFFKKLLKACISR